MIHDLIVYAGWSMGETYMVLGVPMILVSGVVSTTVVGFWSKRWANRMVGYWFVGIGAWFLFALMLWNKPWPQP